MHVCKSVVCNQLREMPLCRAVVVLDVRRWWPAAGQWTWVLWTPGRHWTGLPRRHHHLIL